MSIYMAFFYAITIVMLVGALVMSVTTFFNISTAGHDDIYFYISILNISFQILFKCLHGEIAISINTDIDTDSSNQTKQH